jgi:hypothetical protein
MTLIDRLISRVAPLLWRFYAEGEEIPALTFVRRLQAMLMAWRLSESMKFQLHLDSHLCRCSVCGVQGVRDYQQPAPFEWWIEPDHQLRLAPFDWCIEHDHQLRCPRCGGPS